MDAGHARGCVPGRICRRQQADSPRLGCLALQHLPHAPRGPRAGTHYIMQPPTPSWTWTWNGMFECMFSPHQVALVHSQFQRASTRTDPPDTQLSMDLAWALTDNPSDPALLTRISHKLQLHTMADMKNESIALHNMVISTAGEPDGCVDQMSSLLKKLKDCVVTEDHANDALTTRSASIKHRSPIIPDEFRCPISLELMQDPVIVSSGQVHVSCSIFFPPHTFFQSKKFKKQLCLLFFRHMNDPASKSGLILATRPALRRSSHSRILLSPQTLSSKASSHNGAKLMVLSFPRTNRIPVIRRRQKVPTMTMLV